MTERRRTEDTIDFKLTEIEPVDAYQLQKTVNGLQMTLERLETRTNELWRLFHQLLDAYKAHVRETHKGFTNVQFTLPQGGQDGTTRNSATEEPDIQPQRKGDQTIGPPRSHHQEERD